MSLKLYFANVKHQMEHLNFLGLITFFFDKTIKVVTKIVYFFIIVLVFWFVNDNLNFIYSYRTSDKLEHIEKINAIINNDSTLNPIQRKSLLAEKDYIIQRKTVLERISGLCENVWSKLTSIKTTGADKNENKIVIHTTPQIIVIPTVRKDYTWHFISSNVFLIIVMFAVPFIAMKNTKDPTFAIVAAVIVMWAILFLLAYVEASILNFIPVLWDRPWINYLVNTVINILFWFILSMLIDIRQAKRNATSHV